MVSARDRRRVARESEHAQRMKSHVGAYIKARDNEFDNLTSSYANNKRIHEWMMNAWRVKSESVNEGMIY